MLKKVSIQSFEEFQEEIKSNSWKCFYISPSQHENNFFHFHLINVWKATIQNGREFLANAMHADRQVRTSSSCWLRCSRSRFRASAFSHRSCSFWILLQQSSVWNSRAGTHKLIVFMFQGNEFVCYVTMLETSVALWYFGLTLTNYRIVVWWYGANIILALAEKGLEYFPNTKWLLMNTPCKAACGHALWKGKTQENLGLKETKGRKLKDPTPTILYKSIHQSRVCCLF